MIKFTKKKNDSLDVAIEEAYKSLGDYKEGSDLYMEILSVIEKLENLKQKRNSFKVSPDVMVSSVCSLLGILLILNYERTSIITSKAISFVKGRM